MKKEHLGKNLKGIKNNSRMASKKKKIKLKNPSWDNERKWADEIMNSIRSNGLAYCLDILARGQGSCFFVAVLQQMNRRKVILAATDEGEDFGSNVGRYLLHQSNCTFLEMNIQIIDIAPERGPNTYTYNGDPHPDSFVGTSETLYIGVTGNTHFQSLLPIEATGIEEEEVDNSHLHSLTFIEINLGSLTTASIGVWPCSIKPK